MSDLTAKVEEIERRHEADENRQPDFAWTHTPMDSQGYPMGPSKDVSAYLSIDGAQAHADRATLLTELAALKAERDVMAEALAKLANEASGLRAFEHEVRQAISNTNWECLQLRVDEARKALEDAQ